MRVSHFLLARFDEDEAWIKSGGSSLPAHWARIVLADTKAKRRLIETQGGSLLPPYLMHLFAASYKEHPDWQPEWSE